ncbi:MAG: carbon storage regulator [Alphaproteobacteria bacterium]|nr:MAG: carbon storage regulator [Alphaproteobacteria bacterium]
MLYLTRKVGQSIIINNNIEMTVTEVQGRSVKIGFRFPSDTTILRKEVHDRISEENVAARHVGDDDFVLDDCEFSFEGVLQPHHEDSSS